MPVPRVVKRILAALLFIIVGLAASVVVSLMMSYQSAKVMPQITGLVILALLIFFLGVLLTTHVAGKVSTTFLNRSVLLTIQP